VPQSLDRCVAKDKLGPCIDEPRAQVAWWRLDAGSTTRTIRSHAENIQLEPDLGRYPLDRSVWRPRANSWSSVSSAFNRSIMPTVAVEMSERFARSSLTRTRIRQPRRPAKRRRQERDELIEALGDANEGETPL
jgi:hypothetical protein